MGIYNGVWAHLYRRYVRGEQAVDEKSSLVPNYNETSAYGSTTPDPNTPSSAGVYIPSDRDSVNR